MSKLARNLGIQIKVSAGNDDYTVAHSMTFSTIEHFYKYYGVMPTNIERDQIFECISATKNLSLQAVTIVRN